MEWILAGLMVGPITYILLTLFSRAPQGVADYQFGSRKLNPADVVDSSIMYGLQVAAIALFATWGYIYGFAALIVPAFWAAGYGLFARVLSEAFLVRFAQDTQFRTLHGFLADHNRARAVCVVAAMLTLVGLAGPAMFEAFTVGRAFAISMPPLGPTGGAGLALSFLAVSLIYMTRGGFPGVVRLDQLQMTLGYGGFCAAFAMALVLFADRLGKSVTVWISLACLLAAILMALIKIAYDIQSWRYLARTGAKDLPKPTRDLLGLSAVGIGVVAFIWSTAHGLGLQGPMAVSFPSYAAKSFSFGFSALATLSLLVANGLYQFVDVTQWQRLLSVAVDRDSLGAVVRVLRGNVLVGGFCSALTWVIAVAFGAFLKGVFPDPGTDPYALLPSFITLVLATPSSLAGPLLFVFAAGLVAIMFSTLDALVAATAFTVQQDVLGGDRPQSLMKARIVTTVVLVLQLALYLLVSELAKDRVDAVLYVCWSFQLAMVPIVALLIMGRAGGHAVRILAMVAGAAGALTPLFLGRAELAYEISPWMAVLASSAVYLVFGGWRAAPAPSA